jgi:hypothetical protein
MSVNSNKNRTIDSMPLSLEDADPSLPTTDATVEESEPQTQNSESPTFIVPPSAEPIKLVWTWPWVVAAIFLYTFIIFWMNFSILRRYWIKQLWDEALPGLGTTELRKFTMRMHMTAGATSILLGPVQFVSYFRRNPKWRWVHRYSGRLYCVCGMLSSIFGLWFIALKKRLVGGYNMTASFATAGALIGILSYRAWQTARAAKFGTLSITDRSAAFVVHHNWAIRSYFQIVAPALYRYWYTLMALFDLYKTPQPISMGGYCDAHNYCPEYARPWDAVYTWLYWVSAGVIAECIIYFLPSSDSSMDDKVTMAAAFSMDGDGLNISLLNSSNNVNGGTDSDSSNTTSGPMMRERQDLDENSREESALLQTESVNTGRASQSGDGSYAFVVNGIGCLLAGVIVVNTSTLFLRVFTSNDTTKG